MKSSHDPRAPGSLRFRDPEEAAGFVKLPNPVVFSEAVSDHAFRLYAALRHYARDNGVAWCGMAALALRLHKSPDALTAALQGLTRAGLVTVQRRGQGKTNLYWIEPLSAERLSLLRWEPKTVPDPAEVRDLNPA